MLIPFILIICFGGGMVALTKPFNSKAVLLVVALVVSLLVLGYAPGFTRVFGAVGAIISLIGLFAIRGKR
jgi:hypothetical protein